MVRIERIGAIAQLLVRDKRKNLLLEFSSWLVFFCEWTKKLRRYNRIEGTCAQ
jgi:hypothetical protein